MRMPAAAQPRHGAAHLIDGHPLVHRVEHGLRARLDAHPGLGAAGAPQRRDVLGGHEIGARLTEERQRQPLGGDALGERDQPARLEPEDVVAEPEAIGRVALAQQADLRDDVVGRARVIRVAVDRLRAPVALVRAAARRVRRSARNSRGARARTRGSDRRRRDPRPAIGSVVQLLEQRARAGAADHARDRGTPAPGTSGRARPCAPAARRG